MRKYYLKLSTLIILLVVCCAEAFSQQDAQYTQYMYNTVTINPAYAGNRDVLSIVGLHRSQWVGLEGAPRSYSFTAHSPINGGRVGMGGSIIRDEIGPTEETTLSLDFSYTIPTSETARLSFGLKATGHLLNSNFQKLNAFNPTSGDIRFQQNIDNKFSPNVGVGLFYHTKKFYMGLSAPNMLETSHFDSTNVNGERLSTVLAEERINLYLISGYVFTINDNVLLKPALLLKAVDGAPFQADISANTLLYKKFTIGAAYRWNSAVSGLLGFNVSDSFMIGFAYDKDTSVIGNVSGNSGSYEILMRFELFEKIANVITPRFF